MVTGVQNANNKLKFYKMYRQKRTALKTASKKKSKRQRCSYAAVIHLLPLQAGRRTAARSLCPVCVLVTRHQNSNGPITNSPSHWHRKHTRL